MGFFDGLMKTMHLNNDDEYDEPYEEDDDYYSEEEESGASRRFSVFGNRNQDDDGDDGEARPRLWSPRKQTTAEPKKHNVVMIRPISVEDGKVIAEELMEDKTVLLNMEGLHFEIAQRIIDFTSGAIFALDGNIQKISNAIYIATPHYVNLEGDFQSIMAGAGDMSINGMNNFRV